MRKKHLADQVDPLPVVWELIQHRAAASGDHHSNSNPCQSASIATWVVWCYKGCVLVVVLGATLIVHLPGASMYQVLKTSATQVLQWC